MLLEGYPATILQLRYVPTLRRLPSILQQSGLFIFDPSWRKFCCDILIGRIGGSVRIIDSCAYFKRLVRSITDADSYPVLAGL